MDSTVVLITVFALAILILLINNGMSPKMYVLRVRPYPTISSATRALTDTEKQAIGSLAQSVSIGDLHGETVIKHQDLEAVCTKLGLQSDGSWSSPWAGINWLALKENERAAPLVLVSEAAPDRQKSIGVTQDGQAIGAVTSGTDTLDPASNPGGNRVKPGKKVAGRTPGYMQNDSKPPSSGNTTWVRPVPEEAPFRPHYFHPRAEILAPPRCPRVLISPEAYKRMLLYVELAPKEVGWLGLVKHLESGDFLIDSVHLLEQEVTAVETELSVAGQDKLCEELKQGKSLIEKIEIVNTLRFWGHSHVYMGVSPSWTDEKTMLTKGRDGAAVGLEWYIRGIFNKLGKAQFDVYRFDRNYRFRDVPWAVIDPQTGNTLNLDEKTGIWGGLLAGKPKSEEAELRIAVPTDKDGKVSLSKTTACEPARSQQDAADKPEAGHSDSQSATTVAPPASDQGNGAPSQATAKVPHFTDSLPEQLRPDADLRAQVQAEYDAKVDERTFRATFGSMFSTTAAAASESVYFSEDGWIGDDSPIIAAEPSDQDKPDTVPSTPPDSGSEVADKAPPVRNQASLIDWLFSFWVQPSQPVKPKPGEKTTPASEVDRNSAQSLKKDEEGDK